MENFSPNETANRWINILRDKAHDYEYKAREKGETVSSPDLDDIANEITAFFAGINSSK